MSAAESLRWYVHRLRAMSAGEVLHRVQDRARQAGEAAFLRGLAGFDPGPGRALRLHLPAAEDAPPELAAQLASDAARIQRGEWQVLGWRQVEVGSPPCWHRDPLCGVVVAPETPARKLNHRKLPDGADARTIWEINRWAEMGRLAMHAWLNGDAAALRTGQLWLEDWCERNPAGMGINWTSPLEVALRLINFTWFDHLFAACAARGMAGLNLPAQQELVKKIVPVHAAWVWRYRSAGSSANNHLLGELAALVVAVSRWPGLEKVCCAVDEAWSAVEAEVVHQFAPDGGSREQALHYHLFAFELAWLAARAAGCRAGDAWERLAGAAHFWQALARAEEPWDYGDNDDAQVLPLTAGREHAAAEWRAWLAGGPCSLRYWLGEPPLAAAASRSAGAPGHWQIFAESGMATRSPAAGDDWSLRLDASPLGFGSLAAHGHCDALHLSVWHGEKAIFIDPGTGGYYGHKQLRGELAAWSAHNGPQPVGGFRTPLRLGPFLQAKPHALPTLAQGEEGEITARLEHEGHAFLRSVRVQEGSLWIKDQEGACKPWRSCWYLAPEVQIRLERGQVEGWRFALSRAGWQGSLEIQGPVRCEIQTARASRAYGQQGETSVLVLEAKGTAPVRMTLVRCGA